VYKVSSKCDDEDRSDVGACQSAFEGNWLEPIVTECEFSIVTFFSKTYMNWTSIWTPSFLSDICTRIYIIVNIGRAIYSDKQASRDTDSNHTAKNPGSDLYSLSKKRHWGLCEYIGRSYEFRSITDAERWRWRQMPSLTRRTTFSRDSSWLIRFWKHVWIAYWKLTMFVHNACFLERTGQWISCKLKTDDVDENYISRWRSTTLYQQNGPVFLTEEI
jgi:hypothetical protein